MDIPITCRDGQSMIDRRKEKMNIAVFASHGGSDLQAIIDGCKKELVNAKVT